MIANRLSAFKQLRNQVDFFLLLRVFLFALTVPLLMRLRVDTLETLIERRRSALTPRRGTVQQIVTCVDFVIRIGKPLIRPGCLTRGLTLCYFLRRAGADVKLRFGVADLGDGIVGHCWLVKDGQPLSEVTDPRPVFAVAYEIPNTDTSWLAPGSD